MNVCRSTHLRSHLSTQWRRVSQHTISSPQARFEPAHRAFCQTANQRTVARSATLNENLTIAYVLVAAFVGTCTLSWWAGGGIYALVKWADEAPKSSKKFAELEKRLDKTNQQIDDLKREFQNHKQDQSTKLKELQNTLKKI